MEKISILIADDHKLIRETWSFILNSDARFNVIAQCSNGEEAIEMAQKLRPKIALLDINMSPTNGIEATEQIRKFSPSTKIIAVSMHSQPAYVKKLLKLGAMGYVTKNSPQQEMFEAIMEVNAGRRFICSEVKTILSEQICEERVLAPVALSSSNMYERVDMDARHNEVAWRKYFPEFYKWMLN